MPNISIADIRFLLSRVRGDFLPEEQGGLAPFGPTGIRDVQGVANNDVDVTRPGFWFGAADTLFPRLTFNRLTHPLDASDEISRPFADSLRGSTAIVTIGDTVNMGGKLMDALNPRNTGAVGAGVSMRAFTTGDNEDTLPAASTTSARSA